MHKNLASNCRPKKGGYERKISDNFSLLSNALEDVLLALPILPRQGFCVQIHSRV
jgi:hypothetical protein